MKNKGSTDFREDDFRISSFCDLSQPSPQCVKVAHSAGVVTLRSSRDSTGIELQFDTDEWNAFVKGVKNGEFDFG